MFGVVCGAGDAAILAPGVWTLDQKSLTVLIILSPSHATREHESSQFESFVTTLLCREQQRNSPIPVEAARGRSRHLHALLQRRIHPVDP